MSHSRTPGLIGSAALLLAAASPVAAQEADPDALPVPTGGQLEPGIYASAAVGPEIRFTIADDWFVNQEPIDGLGFWLGPRGPGLEYLTFTRFDGSVFAESCFVPDPELDDDAAFSAMLAWSADPSVVTEVDVSVEAFWEHLRANPHLLVSEPVDIEIGGYPGIAADVIADVDDTCSESMTFLWRLSGTPGEDFGLGAPGQARYAAVDVGGEVVVFVIESHGAIGDHEDLIEQAAAVLDTVTFGTD